MVSMKFQRLDSSIFSSRKPMCFGDLVLSINALTRIRIVAMLQPVKEKM